MVKTTWLSHLLCPRYFFQWRRGTKKVTTWGHLDNVVVFPADGILVCASCLQANLALNTADANFTMTKLKTQIDAAACITLVSHAYFQIALKHDDWDRFISVKDVLQNLGSHAFRHLLWYSLKWFSRTLELALKSIRMVVTCQEETRIYGFNEIYDSCPAEFCALFVVKF